MGDKVREPVKQAFVAPKLTTYGDITSLTQATALSKKKADGGAKLKTRTR
jgi:hypothetical protein